MPPGTRTKLPSWATCNTGPREIHTVICQGGRLVRGLWWLSGYQDVRHPMVVWWHRASFSAHSGTATSGSWFRGEEEATAVSGLPDWTQPGEWSVWQTWWAHIYTQETGISEKTRAKESGWQAICDRALDNIRPHSKWPTGPAQQKTSCHPPLHEQDQLQHTCWL